VLSTQNGDTLWRAAEQVADCLAERGYAFVEDDQLDTLAAALRSFLTETGVPVNAVDASGAVPATTESLPASSPADRFEP
jgi:hypothetical protein